MYSLPACLCGVVTIIIGTLTTATCVVWPQVYRISVTAGQLSESDRQRFAIAVTAVGHALPSPDTEVGAG